MAGQLTHAGLFILVHDFFDKGIFDEALISESLMIPIEDVRELVRRYQHPEAQESEEVQPEQEEVHEEEVHEEEEEQEEVQLEERELHPIPVIFEDDDANDIFQLLQGENAPEWGGAFRVGKRISRVWRRFLRSMGRNRVKADKNNLNTLR
jgi:hypothetical protein